MTGPTTGVFDAETQQASGPGEPKAEADEHRAGDAVSARRKHGAVSASRARVTNQE